MASHEHLSKQVPPPGWVTAIPAHPIQAQPQITPIPDSPSTDLTAQREQAEHLGHHFNRVNVLSDRPPIDPIQHFHQTIQRQITTPLDPDQQQSQEQGSHQSPLQSRISFASGLGLGVQASAATAPGGPQDPCFDLLQEIAELADELRRRYDDMLRDPHNLYHRRRYISDPPISGGTGDPGSWEGHQQKYNERQNMLRDRLDRFSRDCDDDNDPWGYNMQESYDLALEYVDKPAPQEPLPKDRNTLLQRALSLGAEFRDGALWVAEGVGKTALTLLKVIAAILSIPLHIHRHAI